MLRNSSQRSTRDNERSLVRLYLASLAALVICHIVRPWLTAASMSGSIGFTSNLALIPAILSATRLGRVWYGNSLAVAVLTLALAYLSRRERDADSSSNSLKGQA